MIFMIAIQCICCYYTLLYNPNIQKPKRCFVYHWLNQSFLVPCVYMHTILDFHGEVDPWWRSIWRYCWNDHTDNGHTLDGGFTRYKKWHSPCETSIQVMSLSTVYISFSFYLELCYGFISIFIFFTLNCKFIYVTSMKCTLSMLLKENNQQSEAE